MNQGTYNKYARLCALSLIAIASLAASGACLANESTDYITKLGAAEQRGDYAQLYSVAVEMAKSGDKNIKERGYYHLAELYREGNYVEKDHRKALDYYLKASYSDYRIAELYFFGGPNLPRDYLQARDYYKRVVSGLDYRHNVLDNLALQRLGYLYKEGLGGPKDLSEARRMFYTCAEVLSFPIAACMNEWGIFHELGLAGKADSHSAMRWYGRAAQMGDENGRKNRDRLARSLESSL